MLAKTRASEQAARQALCDHARSVRDFADVGSGETAMKMIAYLLAIVCVIVAVMYFVMPAGQLPTFMPGYMEGSTHIHTTHGIAAVVAAVVLLGIGRFAGRR